MGNLWIDLQGAKPTVKGDVNLRNPISDEQARLFDVEDLKKVVAEYYNKKKPDHAWIRSKAMWGGSDMFSKYNITPVHITLDFDSGRVLQKASSPEIVQKTVLTNNSTKKGTFHSDISVVKTETLSSTFSENSSLMVGTKLGVKAAVVTAEVSFEYTTT